METINAVAGEKIVVTFKECHQGGLETCQRINGQKAYLTRRSGFYSDAAMPGDTWLVELMPSRGVQHVRLHEIVHAADDLEEVIAVTPFEYVVGTRVALAMCKKAEEQYGEASVEMLLALISASKQYVGKVRDAEFSDRAAATLRLCQEQLRTDKYIKHCEEVAHWFEHENPQEAEKLYAIAWAGQKQGKCEIEHYRLQEVAFYLAARKAAVREWSEAIDLFLEVGTPESNFEIAKCLVKLGRLAEACEVYHGILDTLFVSGIHE